MSKTLHRPETQLLIELLRDSRVAADLTQAQLSEQLGRAQSFVSDVERGQRRLDLVQLRDWCAAIGSTLPKLVRDFEQRIEAADKPATSLRRSRTGRA
ncbi:MAG: helix-turn-helix transcriptional regulator [Rhodanobacteraceae bacterium]|jgi:transcriptional regulator with XRE-family HTH domain|nr:helix-turn-helix transcriptional regulator [Rhodanobacteraceae bacterium]MBK7044833.1 helix-turn-helix transcriptional regulator [Rhodanobacteraceae bacterium]MBP9155821.1 helix-turn-helix transcriptional regulator [Xanthomonadales bacterium]HQW82562.1 helix-turn-helix transcriptional regulator [Pseudomonadota bacterium]